MIQVAVMGHGVVGSGVVEVLENHRDSIAKRAKEEINIKYILDIREFPDSPYVEKFTKNFDDILKLFQSYEEINWEAVAKDIQVKTEQKETLEKSNDKVKTLSAQLDKVQKDLRILENETITANAKSIGQTEEKKAAAESRRRITFPCSL